MLAFTRAQISAILEEACSRKTTYDLKSRVVKINFRQPQRLRPIRQVAATFTLFVYTSDKVLQLWCPVCNRTHSKILILCTELDRRLDKDALQLTITTSLLKPIVLRTLYHVY